MEDSKKPLEDASEEPIIEIDKTIDQAPKPKPAWKVKLAKFLDHYVVVIFMTVVTVYALFFDDLRIVAFSKDLDDVFYGLTLFGMICFAVEISLASVANTEEYFMSFFFWLDVVSTISMVPDCGWIWDPMTGGGGSGATDLAKTSRAGRVTRVIRVIRLIRLIRIVKLYKQAKLA